MAPSATAAAFKAICPYTSEMIVSGEERPYSVALVSLDSEAITDWARNGLEKIVPRRDCPARLDARVLNRWEQVKRFAILDRELSIAAGDLTPSLKAERNVIVKNFADVIARLRVRRAESQFAVIGGCGALSDSAETTSA